MIFLYIFFFHWIKHHETFFYKNMLVLWCKATPRKWEDAGKYGKSVVAGAKTIKSTLNDMKGCWETGAKRNCNGAAVWTLGAKTKSDV